MKKITVARAKKLLSDIKADQTTLELIVNNIIQYNSLVDEFNNDEKHNAYLMYQLNNQIIKQIQSVMKINKSGSDEVDDDTFNAVVNAIKKNKSQPVIGFVSNKSDDTEKR